MQRLNARSIHRTGRHRCGFSLIEVLVVAVLTAILAAVAVPAMGNLAGSRNAAAARQLARDLNFARQQAIARGLSTWVTLNTTTDTYTILIESTSSPGRASATSLNDPASGRPFSQTFQSGEFQNVDLSSVNIGGTSGNEIGFDWLGRPIGPSDTILTAPSTLSLSGGYSVTIQPQTGFIRSLP